MSRADDGAGPAGICLLLPDQNHRQYKGNNRGYSGQATRDRSSRGRKAGDPQNLLTGILWDQREPRRIAGACGVVPMSQTLRLRNPTSYPPAPTFVYLCGCCRSETQGHRIHGGWGGPLPTLCQARICHKEAWTASRLFGSWELTMGTQTGRPQAASGPRVGPTDVLKMEKMQILNCFHPEKNEKMVPPGPNWLELSSCQVSRAPPPSASLPRCPSLHPFYRWNI